MEDNNKKMKKIIIFIILIILTSGSFFILKNHLHALKAEKENQTQEKIIENPDKKMEIEVIEGSTFGELMNKVGIDPLLTNKIYNTASSTYDLAKIKIGHKLELFFNGQTNEFKKLVYKIDSEDELIVTRQKKSNPKASSTPKMIDIFSAEIKPIDYEIKSVTKEGKVQTSMYVAALENNIDEKAIIKFANAFQWSIDFAMDPRVGDTFKLIYEERYLDGKYQMPGKILAGQYINDEKKYQVYYFKENEDNEGYFDENGNSVQKMFLKAPVAFKYISSGFTTGARYIQAFNISTGHRAIDYAANYGTPIRAVGDGTVIFAGWNGPYGNMVKIRHNSTYQTNYGHMSKFAVKYGEKVKQGEIIGYVGSTGLSTGPHVHFEMVKNGVKINPLTEVLPPGKPIKEENKDRFFSTIKKWQKILNN